MHNFLHTQKILQIISQKFAQIFLTQKFAQIIEQKCVFFWHYKFWNLGENLRKLSTIICDVKYWLILGSNHKQTFFYANFLNGGWGVGGVGGFWDSKTQSEILVAIDVGLENAISIGQKWHFYS